MFVDLLEQGERAFFGRLMAPASELGPIIKAFHGRLYFNLSQLRHITETVRRRVRRYAALASVTPKRFVPRTRSRRRPPLGRLLRALPDLVAPGRQHAAAPSASFASTRRTPR